jgi:excisionase family DNA binding protein
MKNNSMKNNYKLISKSEAARLLGIGKETLTSLIDRGRIKVIMINSRIKISHSELDRFLKDNSVALTIKKESPMNNVFKQNIKSSSDIFNQLKMEANNGKYIQ